MTTWRLLPDDGQRDPRINLAREEAVARRAAVDPAAPAPVLRLWRNAPAVVIGRFQLGAAEVDLAAAASLGAPVLRRFTGGGTVWHDPGNLNVSVVLRPEDALLRADPGLAACRDLYRLVLDPLAGRLAPLALIAARAAERDLVVDRAEGRPPSSAALRPGSAGGPSSSTPRCSSTPTSRPSPAPAPAPGPGRPALGADEEPPRRGDVPRPRAVGGQSARPHPRRPSTWQ